MASAFLTAMDARCKHDNGPLRCSGGILDEATPPCGKWHTSTLHAWADGKLDLRQACTSQCCGKQLICDTCGWKVPVPGRDANAPKPDGSLPWKDAAYEAPVPPPVNPVDLVDRTKLPA